MYVKLVFLLFLCIFNAKAQFFNSITILLHRDDKPETKIQVDNVNFQYEATEIIVEDEIIHTLKSGSFNNLTNLKYIRLPRNEIKILEKNAFINLPSLRVIDLNFNNIEEITENVFANLSLTKLLLKGNGIKTISNEAFYNLINLETLDLSWNNLADLNKKSFYSMYEVGQIDLSYNVLTNDKDTNVLEGLFSEIFSNRGKKYSVINLSYNNLTYLNRRLLKGVYSLEKLLLNNNNIKQIGDDAFDDLDYVEFLNLEANNLESMSDRILGTLRKANEVNLNDNAWSDQFVCVYKKWCKLVNQTDFLSDLTCVNFE